MTSELCAIALSWLAVASPDRADVCAQVEQAARAAGVEPAFAVALSYTESRFSRDAVSSAGAAGPLQILPKYYCPEGRKSGCDLIEAGIGAIIRHQRRYGPRRFDILCHWNSGVRCTPRSRNFARRVLKRRRLLTRRQGD